MGFTKTIFSVNGINLSKDDNNNSQNGNYFKWLATSNEGDA